MIDDQGADRTGVLPRGMIAAGLTELCRSAELEGAAVVALGVDSAESAIHSAGTGVAAILSMARALLTRAHGNIAYGRAPDGRRVMVCPWPTAMGGLALWRASNGPEWEAADRRFGVAASALVRVMLDYGPGEPGLDPLTGIPNRLHFVTEVDRHIERLDRDFQSGTIMLIDLDRLSQINVRLGRAAGDRLLVHLATTLRTIVRPGDIVARVGADEFAVWMGGMDHMTAAERAESLARQPIQPNDSPDLAAHSAADPAAPYGRQTVSIGIATRAPGDGEDARALLRRAHMAAYDAKQAGGDGWRVSRVAP